MTLENSPHWQPSLSNRRSLRALPREPRRPAAGRPLAIVVALGLGLSGCASQGGSQAEQLQVSGASGQGAIPEGSTLSVRSDLKIRPGTYLRRPLGEEGRRGVLRLDGVSGVTLDLSKIELRGTVQGTDLDRNQGFGIVVTGCDDVTIRGGRLGGYKACIVVEDSHDVRIEGVEFDSYYAQRLLSSPWSEDLSDWLRPHDNEQGEWLAEYGAAISITDSSNVVVRECRGRNGQNGILLTRSGGARIYDNDFSFLSGWGLGMYRSSRNVISHNRFDYCVRGFSPEVYWRGQDSAGILMFERCSDNIIAENSATHGGDGLFVFGGKDLVEGRAFERGEGDAGGCDRNLIFRNDFSYAVANSVEITFSGDNRVFENELNGSHQHGVWGGYSNDLILLGNEIRDTLGGAVSIEHGQECLVAYNNIRNNDIGVEFWWDPDEQFVNGPFGQHRDTDSRDHWIVENVFGENIQDVVLKRTSGMRFVANTFANPGRELYIDGLESAAEAPPEGSTVADWLAGTDGARPSGHLFQSSVQPPSSERHPGLEEALAFSPPEFPGSQVTKARERNLRQGLDTIVLGEWGPWDFPGGQPRPRPRRPGGALAGARWDTSWFSWRDMADPRGDLEAWRALKYQPLVRSEVDAWINPWGSDEVRSQVGQERFGLVASTEIAVRVPGVYRLKVVSDDGVRVRVDGQTALEDWTWHPPKRAEVDLALESGMHRFELEYFQIDGTAALTVDLELIAQE